MSPTDDVTPASPMTRAEAQRATERIRLAWDEAIRSQRELEDLKRQCPQEARELGLR